MSLLFLLLFVVIVFMSCVSFVVVVFVFVVIVAVYVVVVVVVDVVVVAVGVVVVVVVIVVVLAVIVIVLGVADYAVVGGVDVVDVVCVVVDVVVCVVAIVVGGVVVVVSIFVDNGVDCTAAFFYRRCVYVCGCCVQSLFCLHETHVWNFLHHYFDIHSASVRNCVNYTHTRHVFMCAARANCRSFGVYHHPTKWQHPVCVYPGVTFISLCTLPSVLILFQ